MKKLLIFCLLFSCFAEAQRLRQGTPFTFSDIWADRFRLPLDSFANAPNGTVYYKNGFVYYKDTTWKVMNQGSGETGEGAFVGIPNVSTLRSFDYQETPTNPVNRPSGAEKLIINLMGWYSPQDGGGGLFFWNDTARYVKDQNGIVIYNSDGSLMTDDGGTFIRPNSITGTNPGRWQRIYSGFVNLRWFGAKADGATDVLSIFNTAIRVWPVIQIGKGYWFFSDSILIKDRKINIFGEGKYETYLLFAAGKKAIKIQFPLASDSYFQGLTFQSQSATISDTVTNGFIARAPVHCVEVDVNGFQGSGFDLRSTLDQPILIPPTDYRYGNTSLSSFTRCQAFNNGWHGWMLSGGDANAIVFNWCSARTNACSGWDDYSFLGNDYNHNHTASNGSRQNSPNLTKVTTGVTKYYAAKESNVNIQPGTTLGWEEYWFEYPTAPEFPSYASEWNGSFQYKGGGSYKIYNQNGFNHLNGNYSEGNQNPDNIKGNALILGGDMANGFVQKQPPWIRGVGGEIFTEGNFYMPAHTKKFKTGLTEHGFYLKGDNDIFPYEEYWDSLSYTRTLRYGFGSWVTNKMTSVLTSPSILGKAVTFSALNPNDVAISLFPRIGLLIADGTFRNFGFTSNGIYSGEHAPGENWIWANADTNVFADRFIGLGVPGTKVQLMTGNWAYKNARNFGNADLIATGQRYHDFANNDFMMDRMGSTRIRTTSNTDTIFLIGKNAGDSAMLRIISSGPGSLIDASVTAGDFARIFWQLEKGGLAATFEATGPYGKSRIQFDTAHVNVRSGTGFAGAYGYLNITYDSISTSARRYFEYGKVGIYPDTAYKVEVIHPTTRERKYFNWHPASGGGAALNFSQYCPDTLQLISSKKMIDGETFLDMYGLFGYYAFPSLTKTKTGRLLAGINWRRNHSDSGRSLLYYSDNYGQTWNTPIVIESDPVENWTNPYVGVMNGDTLLMTISRDGSNLGTFWRYSVDNGTTWPSTGPGSRQRFVAGDTIVTCGKAKQFLNYWVVPIYAVPPSTSKAGFAYSNNSGATWAYTWLTPGIAGNLQLDEMELMIIGDSLVAFVRSDVVGNDTLYRASSLNVTSWTIPVPVIVPEYWKAKPAVYRLADGRILLNHRVRDQPYIGNPDYGAIAISLDNGFTFKRAYTQEIKAFMYGDIEYAGGETYIGIHSSEKFADATKASIFLEYFTVHSCEVMLNDYEVEKVGDPLKNLYVDEKLAALSGGASWSTAGNNGTGYYSRFGTNDLKSVRFQTNGIIGVTFDSLQRFGIGPNLPLYPFHFKTTASAFGAVFEVDAGQQAITYIRTGENPAAFGLSIGDAGGSDGNQIYSLNRNMFVGTNYRLVLNANDNVILQKYGSANVGIGIDPPTAKLHVKGNGLFTEKISYSYRGVNGSLTWLDLVNLQVADSIAQAKVDSATAAPTTVKLEYPLNRKSPGGIETIYVFEKDSVITTNATVTTAQTLPIQDNESGMLTVTMTAVKDNGTVGIVGEKKVGFLKTGGTLTLRTIVDSYTTIVDADLSGSTWTITTSSNNIIIQGTGITSRTIKWVPLSWKHSTIVYP